MSVIIDGYPIDAALEERLTYESEVTEFPVENSSPIADHIIAKLPTLEFDGVVSDTPIGAIANDATRTGLLGDISPSRDAFERFKQLHGDRRMIVVECSFGKFDDMVLVSLTPTRDKTTLKAFKFTAKFQQIEIRQNNRKTVRVSVPGAGGRQNLGALNPLLKELNGKLVFSRAVDSKTRATLLGQGFQIVATTTHADRVASSANGAFDLWERTGLGPTSAMDHYLAVDSELSDGYVVAPNKYRPFLDRQHARIRYDIPSGEWHNAAGDAASKHPPTDPDRWKNITQVRGPGSKS